MGYEERFFVRELRIRKRVELSSTEKERVAEIFKRFLKDGFNGVVQISSMKLPPNYYVIRLKDEDIVYSKKHEASEDTLIKEVKAVFREKTEVQLVTVRYYGKAKGEKTVDKHVITSYITGINVSVRQADGPSFTEEQIEIIKKCFAKYLGDEGYNEYYAVLKDPMRRDSYDLCVTLKYDAPAISVAREAKKVLRADIKEKVFPDREVAISILTETIDTEYL